MKVPQNLSELAECLHVCVEVGLFIHFGEPDEVHDIVDEMIDLLEDVQNGDAELTPLEKALVQAFVLTLEPMLEFNDGTESI
jgi:hypothetical protein